MKQYIIIMQSYPNDINFNGEPIEVPILNMEVKQFAQKKDFELTKILSDLNSVINFSEKILSVIEKAKADLPSFGEKIVVSSYISVNDFENFISDINCLKTNLSAIYSTFGDIPLSKSLKWLIQELDKNIDSLNTHDDVQVNAEKLAKQVEILTVKILFVIQNVFKKYKDKGVSTEQEDGEALRENHLKLLILEELFEDLKKLEMEQIHLKITKIAKIAMKIFPGNNSECRRLVSKLLPVLEQINLFYQYFITQQVSIYRVSCKMCSVFTNIFINLATKVGIIKSNCT